MSEQEAVTEQKIGRYELLSELASGGMATVYLARLGGAGGFQRLFAIKRLHPHLATEREFVEMFLDEARLAARIHHPNVVPILEVGQGEGGYYLVMEYIEGETLARLLGRTASKGERIPLRVVLKVLTDTLAGLDAAHELKDEFGVPLNIVHRDVSPQNVMVGVDGTSRITDFGVARAATRLTTTRAGQLKGKLGYMAPEQAKGEDIDRRADIFAVGVMLWECLASRRLFKGKPDANDAHTLNKLLYEPIPKLVDVIKDIPEIYSEICDRALSRDRNTRFASCAEFADALDLSARLTGGVASPREVAKFVNEVAGPEILAQREAVRNWATRSDVSHVKPASVPSLPGLSDSSSHPLGPSSGTSEKTTADLPQAQPESKRRLYLAAGAGLLLLLAAISLTFLLTRHANAPAVSPPTAATASASPPIASSHVPLVALSSQPAAAATSSASAQPVPSEPSPAAATTRNKGHYTWPPKQTATPEMTDKPTPKPVPEPTSKTPPKPAQPDDLNNNPYL